VRRINPAPSWCSSAALRSSKKSAASNSSLYFAPIYRPPGPRRSFFLEGRYDALGACRSPQEVVRQLRGRDRRSASCNGVPACATTPAEFKPNSRGPV
jgi:hypothetical protein